MIGLMGAHRVGKTTLAQAFAEQTEIELVKTSASAVFKRLGADPKKDYSLDERLSIQHEILTAAEHDYRSAPNTFIADRTPLDMLAYTLADVQRENITEEQGVRIMEYADRCIDVTNKYFNLLVLIQPGIEVQEEDGKAPGNPAYMEHINQLCRGLMLDERLDCKRVAMTRDMTDIDDRLETVDRVARRLVEEDMEQAKVEGFH